MYHDIADDIIKQINEQTYVDKLPSEAQLTDHYQVSRNTIRKAIDEVCQQGLLRRVKGSGYYINQITMHDAPVVNLSLGAGEAMRAVDSHLTSTVLALEDVLANQFQANHLHITIGEPLIHVLRLRQLNGQRYCIEDSYYLKTQVAQLSLADAQQSIFHAVKRDYDISVNNAENYISVTTLNDQQRQLTGIHDDHALLTLTQINYYGNNIAFNLSTTKFFNADLNLYFHSSQTFGGDSK